MKYILTCNKWNDDWHLWPGTQHSPSFSKRRTNKEMLEVTTCTNTWPSIIACSRRSLRLRTCLWDVTVGCSTISTFKQDNSTAIIVPVCSCLKWRQLLLPTVHTFLGSKHYFKIPDVDANHSNGIKWFLSSYYFTKTTSDV